MMSTIVGLANPSYASSAVSVLVNTAAATARTDAVRIGNAPITTESIVAEKMAKRCHACALRSPGGGMNQMMSAAASAMACLRRLGFGGAGSTAGGGATGGCCGGD